VDGSSRSRHRTTPKTGRWNEEDLTPALPPISLRLVPVAVFVHDETPVADPRPCRSEVLEVEGQDRQVALLRDGHHGRIDNAEIEIGELRIYLCRVAEKCRRQKQGGVLSSGDRRKKELGRVRGDPRAQKLVDLDEHEVGNNEIPPQLRHERSRERVRPVTPIRSRDERARVGDDSQRASTNSRR